MSISAGVGCSISKVNAPLMSDSYEVDDSDRELSVLSFRDSEKISVYFQNCSLQEAVNAINKENKELVVMLCMPGEEPEIKVNGLYEGSTSEIVRDLASAYKLKYDIVGEKYYLGAESVDITNVIVYATIETCLPAEIFEGLKQNLPDVVTAQYGSKLLVSGRLSQVKTYLELVTVLEERPRNYVCNLVLVRCRRSAVAELSARVSASSLDLISKGYNLYDVFQAQLSINGSKLSADQYLEQTVYCTDGKESKLKIGSEVQKEKKSVSDYGTASVSGYERFNDGVDFQITPKRSTENFVDVALTFSSSKFSDIEQLAKDQIDLEYTSITLEQNRLYFIGAFTENQLENNRQIIGFNNNESQTVITAWVIIKSVK